MSPALKEKGTEKSHTTKSPTTPRVKPGRMVAAKTTEQEPLPAPSPATTRATTPTTTPSPVSDTDWAIVWLPVAQVDPNPYQPRLAFDAAEMEEMVASVKAYGVLQPVTVRTLKPEPKDGQAENAHANGHQNGHRSNAKAAPVRYHLISGERRLRACREAGRRVIPAIVRDDLSDLAVAELALVENVQRSNLTVIEEAAAYKRLMLEFRLKEERLAKKVGKSVASIKEAIKLLGLPQPVQGMLAAKKLTPSHGQQLLRLAPFPETCRLVAQKAIDDHLTAISLGQTLLPNVRDLRERKLLMELGHNTRFDWREVCGQCAHGAYVQSGYGSYCLRPDEWQGKQAAAIEIQKQESARVLEEAKQEGRTEVETATLAPGSYRDLTHANVPAGCSAACPCRGEASDRRDATRKVPVCLNPNRFTELVQAERQAHQEARRHRLTALWREAQEKLKGEVQGGTGNTLALLLIRPLLMGYGYGARHDYGGDHESWSLLLQTVVQELEIAVPWQTLCDPDADEADVMAVLREVPATDLLLLTGGLWLALEANMATRFGGETPDLDLVLGRSAATQSELPGEEGADEGNEDGASTSEPDGESNMERVELTDDSNVAAVDGLQAGDPDEPEWDDPDADEGEEHEWVWNEAGVDGDESDDVESDGDGEAATEIMPSNVDVDNDQALAAIHDGESDTATS